MSTDALAVTRWAKRRKAGGARLLPVNSEEFVRGYVAAMDDLLDLMERRVQTRPTSPGQNVCHETGDPIEMRCEFVNGRHIHHPLTTPITPEGSAP